MQRSKDSGLSLHGEGAAKRQATTELLFFASVGDDQRCQKIVDIWGLELKNPACCDYDRRTPLHLAAAEGCYSVVAWLLKKGEVDPNPLDRFNRTPLEDAVRGDHKEVATLLMDNGARVIGTEGDLVDLVDSHLSLNLRMMGEVAEDWEIDPTTIKFLNRIGEGEFGVVHQAMWYGTLVAVKVLKTSSAVALGDFKTEINVLQKCHHPHTVQFLGAVTRNPPFMIVTEYMYGGSLSDIFYSGKGLSLDRAVELGIDTAKGMAYLHNKNQSSVCIIHRDLKPANLMVGGHRAISSKAKANMVNETGILKIADFGLSRSIKTQLHRLHANRNVDQIIKTPVPDSAFKEGANSRGQSYKMTGETGSYRYMAPEVFRHETYNEKVDVYAFSMIFYQLLEGYPPFHTLDPVQAAKAAAIDDMRPKWGVRNRHGVIIPDDLQTLVESCWAQDFDDRPGFLSIIETLNMIRHDLRATSETNKKSACCAVQ